MRVLFFNGQSGSDVIHAMRAQYRLRALQEPHRDEPSVVLSQTLVREIQSVVGVAGSRDRTVVLLRPEHVRKPRPAARSRSSAGWIGSAVVWVILAVGAALTLRAVLGG